MKSIYKQCLGIFEAYRRVGFPAADIYLAVAKSVELAGERGIYMLARSQGLEFQIFAGPAEGTDVEISAEWAKAGAAWNTGTEEFRREIWEASDMSVRGTALIEALMRKGFDLDVLCAQRMRDDGCLN